MKRYVLLLLMLTAASRGFAQDVLTDKATSVSFFSSTPLEDIKAKTDKGISSVNIKTKDVYFKVPINQFVFKYKLMKDHFEDSYLEASKFPYADFKGTVASPADLSKDGTYNVVVKGELVLHGVSKHYETNGVIVVKGSEWIADSKFQVKLVDHNIKIPSLMMENIAEVVDVTVHADYKP